jgi:hypothetical protein
VINFCLIIRYRHLHIIFDIVSKSERRQMRISLSIDNRVKKKGGSRGSDRFTRIPCCCPSIIYSANYAFVICGRIGCASARFAFLRTPAVAFFRIFFGKTRDALFGTGNERCALVASRRYTACPFDTRRSHARAKKKSSYPPFFFPKKRERSYVWLVWATSYDIINCLKKNIFQQISRWEEGSYHVVQNVFENIFDRSKFIFY